MPFLINETKAVDIIISFMEKSEYYLSNVEKYLYDNKLIEDISRFSEYCEVVKKAKPEHLKSLIDLI